MTQNNTRLVPLKDYIIQCDERNSENKYNIDDVRGISVNKDIIATKANMEGVSLTPYKLFKPNEFCFVTVTSRNSNKITISINPDSDTYIVSSSYEVFKVRDERILLPEFLYLIFNRPEFDRYARFNSWGSARETFIFPEMERVIIPLPSIDEQKRIVETWKRLRMVKEQNEAIAEPLFLLCQSYIQELKKEYELEPIGKYIRKVTEKNTDLEITLEQGINIKKEFITPQRSNSNLATRVKVRTGQFAYCTQLNNENVAIAYRTGEDCVVSPVYEVFEITDESALLPEYLFQWLIRPEFGRFVYWGSVGSAYEFLRWEDLSSSRIAIPPMDIQRAIVNIYKCAKEAKRIAEEADKLSRELCPALIQKVIHA